MSHVVQVAIGIDDFREVRRLGLEYVDKTQLIIELLDRRGLKSVLLPRPRRFGKSLNLSMLRAFFEKQPDDLTPLFEGLKVFQAGEAYREHFQRYPVIHLTFKGTRHLSFEGCWEAIREKIRALFREHQALLESGVLDEWEAQSYRAVLDGTASRGLYERSLFDLSSYLHRRHGEQVVLLLDEYDEPIHAGYANGYTREIIDLCRGLLTEGLKGNPHLFKAVLTGILRVARENIFSGLNNLGVFTLLDRDFNTCFGFTDDEVRDLLARSGRLAHLDDVRAYYNGYVFGGAVVYNPWSVLNFIGREGERIRGYWVATSSNDLVRELLEQHAFTLEADLQTLLAGGTIERRLFEDVTLGDLRARPEALYALLVLSGYLKAEEIVEPVGEPVYRLSIPNREVYEVYSTTFQHWLARALARRGRNLDMLITALLGGDAEELEQQLAAFVENALSYHDLAPQRPEQVYQAFVIGLLATLEGRYEVRSNRESGRGRADVLVQPREAGKPGVVLELEGREAGEAAAGGRAPGGARADPGAELRGEPAGGGREPGARDGGGVRWEAGVGEGGAGGEGSRGSQEARGGSQEAHGGGEEDRQGGEEDRQGGKEDRQAGREERQVALVMVAQRVPGCAPPCAGSGLRRGLAPSGPRKPLLLPRDPDLPPRATVACHPGSRSRATSNRYLPPGISIPSHEQPLHDPRDPDPEPQVTVA
ncbi:MAG: AAA family ATPase [Minicystis sp.]